jgi:hypothetical protein
MTYSQRLKLIEQVEDVPYTQQAKLLSVSRSSIYYKPDVSDWSSSIYLIMDWKIQLT